ncbi:MAG: acyl-CoA dehydratase activase-related protein [Bilophila wadsworthia]
MKACAGRQGRGHAYPVPAGTFPTAEAHPYANHCSYIQFIPDLVNEAFKLEASGIRLIRPALHFRMGREQVLRELERTAASLGVSSRAEVRRACDEAYAAQARFREARNALGREALDALGPDGKAVVLVGKAHSIHDPGTNMNLARILRRHGASDHPRRSAGSVPFAGCGEACAAI